ncbi:MAG: hypothetical protein ACLQU9_06720 [Acidimicrobiales bacterium]|jgi:hypothetical protein
MITHRELGRNGQLGNQPWQIAGTPCLGHTAGDTAAGLGHGPFVMKFDGGPAFRSTEPLSSPAKSIVIDVSRDSGTVA